MAITVKLKDGTTMPVNKALLTKLLATGNVVDIQGEEETTPSDLFVKPENAPKTLVTPPTPPQGFIQQGYSQDYTPKSEYENLQSAMSTVRKPLATALAGIESIPSEIGAIDLQKPWVDNASFPYIGLHAEKANAIQQQVSDKYNKIMNEPNIVESILTDPTTYIPAVGEIKALQNAPKVLKYIAPKAITAGMQTGSEVAQGRLKPTVGEIGTSMVVGTALGSAIPYAGNLLKNKVATDIAKRFPDMTPEEIATVQSKLGFTEKGTKENLTDLQQQALKGHEEALAPTVGGSELQRWANRGGKIGGKNIPSDTKSLMTNIDEMLMEKRKQGMPFTEYVKQQQIAEQISNSIKDLATIYQETPESAEIPLKSIVKELQHISAEYPDIARVMMDKVNEVFTRNKENLVLAKEMAQRNPSMITPENIGIFTDIFSHPQAETVFSPSDISNFNIANRYLRSPITKEAPSTLPFVSAVSIPSPYIGTINKAGNVASAISNYGRNVPYTGAVSAIQPSDRYKR